MIIVDCACGKFLYVWNDYKDEITTAQGECFECMGGSMSDEDGKLLYCKSCAEETPTRYVQYGKDNVPTCELCGSRYQKRVYDLPNFKEKN